MIYKTIGVGGNYADIGAAWVYLVSLSILEDDYTFTIISDFIEVTGGVSVSWDVNWAQKTISFLNPNGYWITHITNDGYTFMSRGPGNNINDKLIVDGLRIKYLGLLTGINVDALCARSEWADIGITSEFKNVTILALGGCSSSSYNGIHSRYFKNKCNILNCRIYGLSCGIQMSAGVGTTGGEFNIENCSTQDCGIGIQISTGTDSGVLFSYKNIVCNGSNTDFVFTNNPHVTIKNCADSDNTLLNSGTNSTRENTITGIVDGDFVSVDPDSDKFLTIDKTSALYQTGTTDISSWNTEDFEGNPRPNANGLVSIGAYEPVIVVLNTISAIRPVISNQRVSPYRLGTSDLIKIKADMYNGNKKLQIKDILLELYLNYPSGEWIKYGEVSTNRNGSQLIQQSCVNFANINNCLGYVKATFNGRYYTSNTTRFNFITSGETTNSIIEMPDEIVVYENQYFTF